MPKEFDGLYSIEGFQVMPGLERGRYGFAINLRGDVARSIARSDKRNEDSALFTELLTLLHDSSHKYDQTLIRIDYYKDTWLMIGMAAGGDCACFGIDGNDRTDVEEKDNPYIRYKPHNIDTAQQASAILSTWLHWFNHAITLTQFNQL